MLDGYTEKQKPNKKIEIENKIKKKKQNKTKQKNPPFKIKSLSKPQLADYKRKKHYICTRLL